MEDTSKKDFHISINRNYIFLFLFFLAVFIGFTFGKNSVPSNEDSWLSTCVDVGNIDEEMYLYQDTCVQKYQDGMEIAGELEDPYLLKKYLQLEGYVTHMDVAISKEMWVENCMYKSAIANEFSISQ